MLSDIGRRRKHNEDTVDQRCPDPHEVAARLGNLFVLADGFGDIGGKLASQTAVAEVMRAYYDDIPVDESVATETHQRLLKAVELANSVVYHMGQGRADLKLTATTLVMAAVQEDTFAVASVGDSPAFHIRDGEVRKLTIDHNFAEMQWRAGLLSYDEAWRHPDRRKLVRAVGWQERVEVDVTNGDFLPGDYLVLCSDGLTRYISLAEISEVLHMYPLAEAVQELISRTNERGGSDNVSVIVIHSQMDERQRRRQQRKIAAMQHQARHPVRVLSRVLRGTGLTAWHVLAFFIAIIRNKRPAKDHQHQGDYESE